MLKNSYKSCLMSQIVICGRSRVCGRRRYDTEHRGRLPRAAQPRSFSSGRCYFTRGLRIFCPALPTMLLWGGLGLPGDAEHLWASEGTLRGGSDGGKRMSVCPSDSVTVPTAAFSCLSYETVLCRVVHRNLKLYFNNRSPALLTEKVIYFAVSSHIITQSHIVDSVLLHFAIQC